MKTKLVLLTVLAALIAPLRAADKAQIEARYQSYYAAGKAVVDMALSKKIDAAEVAKRVDIMVADAIWFAGEYAKAHPKGAKLLQTVTSQVGTMRQLSFEELESEWHDLGYFTKAGHDTGLDLKAEENEHFTDPIHTLVHPLLVLKAAQAYATSKAEKDLKSLKEEMDEGLEQAEKQKTVLLKS